MQNQMQKIHIGFSSPACQTPGSQACVSNNLFQFECFSTLHMKNYNQIQKKNIILIMFEHKNGWMMENIALSSKNVDMETGL